MVALGTINRYLPSDNKIQKQSEIWHLVVFIQKKKKLFYKHVLLIATIKWKNIFSFFDAFLLLVCLHLDDYHVVWHIRYSQVL